MKRHNLNVFIRVKGDSTIYSVPFKEVALLSKYYSKENLIMQAKTILTHEFPLLTEEELIVVGVSEEKKVA